jgi:Flp pilus assembly protein TadG
MKRRRSESGQSYIIMAMMMVGMLGFSALAIDGGMLYHEHRRAQNAADAAAMAAALAKVNSQPLGTVALTSTTSNDFVTTAQSCSPAGLDCILGVGTDLTIEVTNPPRVGLYAGNPEYIRVYIEHKVNTSFAHLVFTGGLHDAAEAVSRVWPAQSFISYSIFATSDHACKAVWFSGTGDTNITGGGVYSNSDAASASCQSGVQGGGGAITVNPPDGIEVVGTFDMGGSGAVSPAPTENTPKLRIRPMMGTPDCSALWDYGKMKINSAGAHTIFPGRYSEITVLAGADVTMDPGMYCVYGNKGFTSNGGSITGTDIFIYMEDGDFNLGGNTLVNLSAVQPPNSLVDPSFNDWAGMLLYVDPNNTNPITITGASNTVYTGTIYAPSSLVTLEGGGTSIGINAQIIGDTVKISGNAELNITYDESKNFFLPPAIDLVK